MVQSPLVGPSWAPLRFPLGSVLGLSWGALRGLTALPGAFLGPSEGQGDTSESYSFIKLRTRPSLGCLGSSMASSGTAQNTKIIEKPLVFSDFGCPGFLPSGPLLDVSWAPLGPLFGPFGRPKMGFPVAVWSVQDSACGVGQRRCVDMPHKTGIERNLGLQGGGWNQQGFAAKRLAGP